MKESERIDRRIAAARDSAGAGNDAIAHLGYIVAGAILEIARQLAITREEHQEILAELDRRRSK